MTFIHPYEVPSVGASRLRLLVAGAAVGGRCGSAPLAASRLSRASPVFEPGARGGRRRPRGLGRLWLLICSTSALSGVLRGVRGVPPVRAMRPVGSYPRCQCGGWVGTPGTPTWCPGCLGEKTGPTASARKNPQTSRAFRLRRLCAVQLSPLSHVSGRQAFLLVVVLSVAGLSFTRRRRLSKLSPF